MTLVNLEGTAILGAGSEWFWAMAQFVLVAASILGIYFQLRAQRASSLFEQTAALSREWNEEAFLVNRLAALLDLEDRPVASGLPLSGSTVGNFFERIGYLVALKHIRASDVWYAMRPQIGFWWLFLEPYLDVARRLWEAPRTLEWFEKLELEMRRLDAEHGDPDFASANPMTISEAIDDISRQLRLLADARNGIYPARQPKPEPAGEA